MTCGFVRTTGRLADLSIGWAKTAPASGNNATQTTQADLHWKLGCFIRPRPYRRVKELYSNTVSHYRIDGKPKNARIARQKKPCKGARRTRKIGFPAPLVRWSLAKRRYR